MEQLTEKQFNDLVEKVGSEAAAKIKSEFAALETKNEAALQDLVNKAEFEAKVKSIDALEEALRKQGETITELKNKAEQPSVKAKSIADTIVDGFMALQKEGKLTGLKHKNQWETLELKTVGTMTTSYIDGVGTNSIPYNLASYEPGVTPFVRRNPFIAQLMNGGRTNKMYVQWTEMANAEGGAASTAEGASKSQYDFELVEKSAKVEKITAYTKVTKEMLDDVSFIEAEIRNELVTIIALKLDEQLLSGDGTSNTMKGILEYAQDFADGDFAGTVPFAKEVDVLAVAIQQVMTANFMPNYIVLNPIDVTKMKLAKAEDGQYVLPPFATVNGLNIDSVPVVANNGVTAGTFLVGDFTKSNLRIREDISISVGLDGDDFTKNLVTILAEVRGVHFVKSQHEAAFVKGTFSTAIAAINQGVA